LSAASGTGKARSATCSEPFCYIHCVPRRRGLSREEIEAQYETTGGFMIPLRMSRRTGLIWVGVLAAIAVLALVGGLPGGTGSVDLGKVLEPFPAAQPADGPRPTEPRAIAEDAQAIWKQLFAGAGEDFEAANIVVFDRSAASDCLDFQATEPGTFYCHADDRFLVDRRLADGYRIAHGYAHHVQELLGITDQIARAVDASPSQGPDLWRRHELQADCLAGVWAHAHAGAYSVTDVPTTRDHFIEPTSWTGAPAEQRSQWFRRGSEAGNPAVCDTFSQKSV
jgi:predicted metalloprotease